MIGRIMLKAPSIHFVALATTAIAVSCFGTVLAAATMESYVSEVDGSEQPYGLYIPQPFDPDVPHAVVFHGHGFGGRANANFSSFQRSYADARGWILVNLDGRGNTFWDGMGENDFFRALGELRNRYPNGINTARLHFTGASMGATGAFRLGFRHPDVFAAVGGADGWCDYHQWHRHWYAKAADPYGIDPSREPLLQSGSPLDIAENGKHLWLRMVVDTNDTTVWPQNGRQLHTRLDELGYSHSYHENTGGHTAGYDITAIYEYFSRHLNKPSPKDVVLKANELKYASAYWARIDRLEKSRQFATIEVTIGDGAVEVTASHLHRYTLLLTPELVGADEVSVYTNGELNYVGPVGEITVSASLDESGSIVGWSTSNTLPRGLSKTAQIEGPIGHAFTSRFLLIRGTVGSKSETSENRSEAEKFAGEWNSWMHANISPVTDTSITEEDIATSNLILFGTADSNSLIQAINDLLPIRIWRNRIVAGANTYEGTNYGLYMVFPNPLNPERYVVISHGTIEGSYEKELEALPWYWPDYVVFDMNVSPSITVQPPLVYLPDAWVEAGYFDQYWRLDKDKDGMDDIFEKDIIDADPDDDIASIEDVNPSDDFDGDGHDNEAECNAGTDPTVADSYFSVLSVNPDPADAANFQVSWKVAPARSYCVFWAESADGPWHEIEKLNPDDVSGDGDVRTWTDKGNDPAMGGKKPGDCAARFYKVIVFR